MYQYVIYSITYFLEKVCINHKYFYILHTIAMKLKYINKMSQKEIFMGKVLKIIFYYTIF